MRLIHTGGFTKEERKQWRVVIFHNLTGAFQILFAAMEEQQTDFEDEGNTRCADLVRSDPEIGTDEVLPYEYLHVFSSLWADKGTQLAMLKGNEYALHDNLN
jgi:guanine nucleotide-binding protein subunit alpha, other